MLIEEKIGKLLCEKNATISIAESLTGGLLCGRLVNYPGISKVLIEGIVSYSIESKIKRLEVQEETIKLYTDVSDKTAIEMARGICETSGSDIGISTTGIAGPGGEPVGRVFIGFCIYGESSYLKLTLSGDRSEIRNETVSIALDTLYEKLTKKFNLY